MSKLMCLQNQNTCVLGAAKGSYLVWTCGGLKGAVVEVRPIGIFQDVVVREIGWQSWRAGDENDTEVLSTTPEIAEHISKKKTGPAGFSRTSD